ncbi:glycerate kinase family protein [Facklamia sp. P9177]|uniref:glycerate kinase family protein n=1 Tax=Facklamia sp. P9177 TaxID=3421945 RepID=UPI003D181517
MKILAAIDSFKGSMTSEQANLCVKDALPNHSVTCFPIADGGEGTVDAFVSVLKGEYITQTIKGVDGKAFNGKWGWIEQEKLAIIEVAQGAGIIHADPKNLDPTRHTSYGVGQQLIQALDFGAERIILGLGGSATVDGGMGLLQALGLKFFDSHQQELPILPVELNRVASMDPSGIDRRMKQVDLILASDVNNPLIGPKGASYVFGPQKGLATKDLPTYDASMKNYADLLLEATKKDYRHLEGAGAAGGIGFALSTFFGAKFRNGLFLLAEKGNLDALIKEADLIITGEGRFDDQSLSGKVPIGISRLAKKYQVPVLLFAGQIDSQQVALPEENLFALIPIVDRPMELDRAMELSQQLLTKAVERTINLIEFAQKNKLVCL